MRGIDQKLFSRNLRKNQTNAELLLWQKLRNRQIDNVKFRRQQIIGRFIVDFVSFDNSLIIELDGGQHNNPINKENDDKRTEWLETQGYRIIRFWDNEVSENLSLVLERIHLTLTLSLQGY